MVEFGGGVEEIGGGERGQSLVAGEGVRRQGTGDCGGGDVV